MIRVRDIFCGIVWFKGGIRVKGRVNSVIIRAAYFYAYFMLHIMIRNHIFFYFYNDYCFS